MIFEGLLIQLQLNDHVFLIADEGLSCVSPAVDEVGHVVELGRVVIDDEVLEAVGDVS